ncbi:hypothetical protein Tco_1455261, partial [Tanacetum coccineum]
MRCFKVFHVLLNARSDMFRVTLHFPVETPENPFVAPVNIETIEAFMNRVGYQGVVDKLILADLMKKFPEIPQRIEESYHSIKDDIPLVNVYTTGDVRVREMLIPDAFLTKEIHATDDFKESTPRAHRTPTVSTTSPQGKKRKQIIRESSSPRKTHKITFKNYIQSNVIQVPPTTTTSTKTTSLADLQQQLYFKMKRSLQDQANDQVLWKVLKDKFEKSSTSNTSCRDDDIHSHHDDQQEDDAPPEGEKRVKRHKASKSSKSAREWDEWVEEIVIDEDEVILEDETPKLITELQDVDKRVLTIFDFKRMKATLNDALSNQFKNTEEYSYHLEQTTNFIENRIVWESRQENIRRPVPRPLVFFGPQQNPNEPP